MKLYEINEAYRAWVEKVVEAEGEVTEELAAELQGIEGNLEEKAEAYAALLEEQEMYRQAIAEQVARL